MIKETLIIFALLWFSDSFSQTTTWTHKLFCPTSSAKANNYFNEGVIFLKSNELNKAIAAYSNSILEDTLFCDAYDNLGIALRRKGDYNGALTNYLKSYTINNENYVACTNSGELLLLARKYELAYKLFCRVIELDSMNPEGYYGKTKCLIAFKDYTNALISLEAAKEKYRILNGVVGKDVLFLEAFYYFMKEDIPTAKRLLEEIYDSYSEEASVNLYLGYCYIDPRYFDKSLARKYFKKAQDAGIEIDSETWDLIK